MGKEKVYTCHAHKCELEAEHSKSGECTWYKCPVKGCGTLLKVPDKLRPIDDENSM